MEFNAKIEMQVGLKSRGGVVIPAEFATTEIALILSEHGHHGFTVMQQHGYWRGEAEDSLCISVMINAMHLGVMAEWATIAYEIAKSLDQEAVLLAEQPLRGMLVYTDSLELKGSGIG